MPEDATTANLEAFKFFARGVELSMSGRTMDAIPPLKRAVEIDPDFAYAWSVLSVMHGYTGRPGLAAQYAGKAYALRERVGEYEKLRIPYWYHAWVTGDVEKQIEALTLQEQMYPRKWLGRPADFAITYALEAVAILVAMLGAANSLLALVLDRRREFGLLRFLGAAPAQIRRMVLIEAAFIGLLALTATSQLVTWKSSIAVP
jgi:hypothetical protein